MSAGICVAEGAAARLHHGMRRWWIGCLWLACAAGALAQGDFMASLSEEERRAAGLDKLTPGELTRLKAVVERYKAGEVAEVREAAKQEVAAAAARARAEAAPAGDGKRQPGWLAALVTLRKAEDKPDEAEDVESRLAGRLTNFSGRRSFPLQNGQVWQMTEAGSYAGPALEDPRVLVRPALGSQFWLKIPEAGLRVRVKPVKLE
jgi:hypothetical protein